LKDTDLSIIAATLIGFIMLAIIVYPLYYQKEEDILLDHNSNDA